MNNRVNIYEYTLRKADNWEGWNIILTTKKKLNITSGYSQNLYFLSQQIHFEEIYELHVKQGLYHISS